jgi:hypothetical protein
VIFVNKILEIPEIWREATIIPIPKPNKDPTQSIIDLIPKIISFAKPWKE